MRRLQIIMLPLCQGRHWCNILQKLVCRCHDTVFSISLFLLKSWIILSWGAVNLPFSPGYQSYQISRDAKEKHRPWALLSHGTHGLPNDPTGKICISDWKLLGHRGSPFELVLFYTYSQYSWAATSDVCISFLFSNGCNTCVLLPHTMCLIKCFQSLTKCIILSSNHREFCPTLLSNSFSLFTIFTLSLCLFQVTLLSSYLNIIILNLFLGWC